MKRLCQNKSWPSFLQRSFTKLSEWTKSHNHFFLTPNLTRKVSQLWYENYVTLFACNIIKAEKNLNRLMNFMLYLSNWERKKFITEIKFHDADKSFYENNIFSSVENDSIIGRAGEDVLIESCVYSWVTVERMWCDYID